MQSIISASKESIRKRRAYVWGIILFWMVMILVNDPFNPQNVDGYGQLIKLLAWSVAVMASLAAVLLIREADEKSFLILAGIFGMLMVFYNPFPHRFDESTHFFRSYVISEGKLLDTVDEGGNIGGMVSSNYAEIVEEELSLKSYYEDPDRWNQSFSDETSFYGNKYMSSVAPIDHAVAAIGAAAGRLLGFPAVAVILLGRMADLVFYIACAYLAIKKARYYKSLFFMAALLPTNVWLAASYSIDPVVVGASLLFTSICMHYYMGGDEQRMSTGDCLLMLLCAVFIISVKYMVYMPILLLFFIIPRRRFSRRQYRAELTAAIMLILLLALVQLKLLDMFNFTEDRNGDVDVARQIRYMLDNPVVTVRNYASYVLNNTLGLFQTSNYWPRSSDLSTWVNSLVILSAALEQNKYRFDDQRRKTRLGILCVMIFSISYALTIAALYAGFTPVGKWGVDGIQPRYLLPVVPALMLAISNLDIENRIKNYGHKMTFIMELGLVNMTIDVLLGIFS